MLLTGLHELSLTTKHLGEGSRAAGEGVLHDVPLAQAEEKWREEGDEGRSAALRHEKTENWEAGV